MAETDLTPEEAAADARLPLYNVGDYDPVSNEFGFDNDGHQVNQMRQARDAGVMGRLARRLALFVQGLANTAMAATAGDREQTSRDRIATGEDRAAAAGSAVEAANQAQRLVGTSATSVATGTGAKSFATQAGKHFAVGTFLLVVSTAVATRWMHGQVTAYNAATGALTLNVGAIGPTTGTVSSWNIYTAGPQGPQGNQGIPGIATMPYAARSANAQIVKGDSAKLFDLTGTFTQTFDTPANLGPDWYAWLDNSGTGTITLSNVSGLASVAPGALVIIQSDGTTLRGFVANASGKGRAGGFAELDAAALVPDAQSRGPGNGQAWQSVSRSQSVSYQNTTSRPIVVQAGRAGTSNGVVLYLEISADNNAWTIIDQSIAVNSGMAKVQGVVPSGLFYRFTQNNPSFCLELR